MEQSISEQEQRIAALKSQVYKLMDLTHDCNNHPLIHCCNEWRCEVCQSRHLLKHPKVSQLRWWVLHQTTHITQPSLHPEVAKEVKKQQGSHTKTRTYSAILKAYAAISEIEAILGILKGES